jgi:hypothetical protein
MSIQTRAQLNESLVRGQFIDEDIDYDILEKYPLYKDYLFTPFLISNADYNIKTYYNLINKNGSFRFQKRYPNR